LVAPASTLPAENALPPKRQPLATAAQINNPFMIAVLRSKPNFNERQIVH
jgi:hypothetical protein